MLNAMKKIIFAVATILSVLPATYIAVSYAQQAADVEFMKVSDYLALKNVDPAVVAKILAAKILPDQYIALHPGSKDVVEVGDPATKKDFYIVMTDLGKTLTEKAKKGEPLIYPIDPTQYKPGKGLIPVPDVQEIPKPPAASATPPVQPPPAKPANPAIVKGELEDVYKSRDGKKYVIQYSVPDPANPGKMLVKHISIPAAPKLMGFEELSDVDSNSPVYFKYEYNEKNEIIGITIINPDPAIKLKPLVVGGKVVPNILKQETYVVDEIKGVIVYPKLPNLDARLINGLIQPPAVAPTETPKKEVPVAAPAEKDYEAPSAVQKNWWDNILDWRKKPAVNPAPTPPEAAAAATADPRLPRGRQPKKPKESADPVTPPVATPVKNSTEDVPGVVAPPAPKRAALSDLDSWDPVTAPITLSPEEIKAGYKPEGFSFKELKDASGKTTGYEVGIAFCPDGGLACGPIKKAISTMSFKDAKDNAMKAAKAAYDAQFSASKNQFIMPGSMKK